MGLHQLLRRKMFGMILVGFVLSAGLTPRLSAQTDEELLSNHKLPTDGPTLLTFFRERTLHLGDVKRIEQLIEQLGDESFDKREEASGKLIQLGERAKPFLVKALKEPDVEVVRRARECLNAIERGVSWQTIVAAVHVLGKHNPEGTTRTLLDYLPSADHEQVISAIHQVLGKVAVKDGKADPVIVASLKDENKLKRAAAAVALAKSRAKEQLPEVRKLLEDREPLVRLQVALALCEVPRREAIPALIGLLDAPGLSPDELGKAEDLLYRLANENAPEVLPGSDAASRRRYREAWEKWWEKNKDFDIARLEEITRTFGHTLVVLLDENIVQELDENNKVRWQLKDVEFPLDVQLLSGDRVLLAENQGNRVTERNLKGEVLWEKKILGPLVAQRLPNGNTFIANREGVVEVNRDGEEVYSYTRPAGELIMRAAKLPNGDIALVTQLGVSRYVRLDASRKERKSFGVNVQTFGGKLDVLPNGNVLIPELGTNRVVEYDAQGKMVGQVDVESPVIATRLRNGNTLVTSINPQVGAVELDRSGKVVWQYRATSRVTRAYRR